MKSRSALIASTVAALALVAPLEAVEIKTMTFNVLAPCWADPSYYDEASWPYLDRYERREAIINVLTLNDDVDVFLLQEVTDEEYSYFAAALSEEYDGFMSHHDPEYWSDWETEETPWEPNGNAIFVKRSTFVADSNAFKDVATGGTGNHTAFFTGFLTSEPDRMVRIASIHLDSDHSINRKLEYSAIVEYLPPVADAIDIVGGDFNVYPETSNFRNVMSGANFTNALTWLGTQEPTHPWTSGYYQLRQWNTIDHITVRGATPIEGFVYNNDIPERYPVEIDAINATLDELGSDHFAVQASFSW